MMLRKVRLPAFVSGELYLAAMPGRYRPLDEEIAEAQAKVITRATCLAPGDEVRAKSPAYREAWRSGSLPWATELFAIPDYGVPDDREAFAGFVNRLSGFLRSGERVMVHCGGGIGRTGTVAVCVLVALGMSQGDAGAAVAEAGSHAETPEQRDLVRWFAKVNANT